MTTRQFSALASAIAQTMAAVRAQHCQPPHFRPTAPVSGSFGCMKCGGKVSFTVSEIGRTAGRCSSVGCIRWND
jgi:hypothetical protein